MNAAGRVPTLIEELRCGRAAGGLVAGVDEVGRGPVAGPVVAAAVILPLDDRPAWLHLLRDSKQLSPERRTWLASIIVERSRGWGVASVASDEIDRLGIAPAAFTAMRRALGQLPLPVSHVLVDAFQIPEVGSSQSALVRGDARCASIAAASIVAKVARDRIMVDLDDVFPGYGLAQHKGYATAQHLAAIERNGLSPIHRRSFLDRVIAAGRDGD